MAHGGFKDLVTKRGFSSFLLTQFLGAFNDQIYQTVVMLYANTVHGGAYVPLVAAVFNLPFLLFSGWSGPTGHLRARIAVTISLTVVLPQLPVIPITRWSHMPDSRFRR